MQSTRECGCYSMQTRFSNLIFSCSLTISSDDKLLFRLDYFYSLSLSEFVLNGNGSFPPTAQINSFDIMRFIVQLQDEIETAYARLQKSLQKEWGFVQHVTLDIGNLWQISLPVWCTSTHILPTRACRSPSRRIGILCSASPHTQGHRSSP